MQYTNEAIKNKKKKIAIRKRIISLAIYIVILPLIFYNILLIVFSIIKPNETPSFLGIKTFVIVSGSMEPNLNVGDIVIIKKCDENDIKEDDIISFREGQTIITHRVKEINDTENGREYVTKGDNNNVKDNTPVKYSNIEGVCIGRIEHIGNIVLALKNKIVIIAIILIFYLIYSHDLKVTEKKRSRREKRRKFEDRQQLK